jgi:hypothetical protein
VHLYFPVLSLGGIRHFLCVCQVVTPRLFRVDTLRAETSRESEHDLEGPDMIHGMLEKAVETIMTRRQVNGSLQ